MNNREPQFDYPFPPYDRLEKDRETTGMAEGEPLARVHLPYGGDAWLARRHADVRAVMTDSRFSRAAAINADVPRAVERLNTNLSLPMMDPPEHTRQRRLVMKAFTAKRIEALRPWIEGLADDLLVKIAETGPPADLVDDFAWPLPIQVISELLGVSYEDRDEFREWTDAAISVTAHSTEEAEGGMRNLLAYMSELAAKRRQDPGQDLLTSLVQIGDEEGGLREDEIAMYGVVLLIGGYETTANQLGNIVYTLLKHPEQHAQLVADPGLVDSAVEELLRYIPINAAVGMPQIATEDVEMAGVVVKAGDTVFIDHAAANRDPQAFENPDELDFRRSPNPQLTLGHGPHRCLGAQLGRLELTIALNKTLQHLPDLALAAPEEELTWKRGRQFRSLEHLPVTWSQ
ncbi:cytochrome P450 [Streptomyces boncukensis]|uniref:Cytochrome P450 n=1 Tax=Streptomyces boncukensis TaxID=2711219 RepID=A0A6G4WRI6_9ACTN|nr:cytochrome P450 [Streptomyces boncukensis]NGO67237.1 cytochrome P450 [Streptomyces boncukensis]